MKKILLFSMTFCIIANCFANIIWHHTHFYANAKSDTFIFNHHLINGYEYWFDTAYQNHIVSNFNPNINDTNYNLVTDINTESLTSGFHLFNIRFTQDTTLNVPYFSSTISKYFVKTKPRFSNYQFWFDNGIQISVPSRSIVSDRFILDNVFSTEGLSEGLHTFNFRCQDSSGGYSGTKSSYFFKTIPVIANYEYWFDNYLGSKTVKAVTNGSSIVSLNDSIFTNSLSNGYHIFNIRFKDMADGWSSVRSAYFVKVSDGTPNSIKVMKYWFDNNHNSAVSQTINNPAANLVLGSAINTGNLVGQHTVHLQFQDNGEAWSSVWSDTSTLLSSNISYFNPLYGCEGTAVTITGNNLSGATKVSFNGTETASFTINSPTSITAIVPVGALSGNLTVTVPQGVLYGSTTYSVVRSDTTFAYISNFDEQNRSVISVINANTQHLVTNIPVGINPTGICVSPDASKVYVANAAAQYVSVISTATNMVIDSISCSTFPTVLCISPNGLYLYVANRESQSVSVFNTITKSLVNILVGYWPSGIIISKDGNKVFVTNSKDNTVSTINTSTDTVEATVFVGFNTNPIGICVSNDGLFAYSANNLNGTVSVINTHTYNVDATIRVGNGPKGICTSTNGKWVYVANSMSGNISVINTTTNTVELTIPTGGNPQGISISNDGTKLIVSSLDSSVIIVNTQTNTVDARVAIPKSSQTMGNFVAELGRKCYNMPTISSFFPHLALIGDTITIKGNHFSDVTNVTIGGVMATSYRIINDSTINAIVSNGTSVYVSVTTPDGTATIAGFTLPLKLTSFVANSNNKIVETKWQTATEINTAYFKILHSTDGISFTNMGTIIAIGSGENIYQFMDNYPDNGINYYRLQIVYNDGTISYGKVVSVSITNYDLQFTVYPNPVGKKVTINGRHIESIHLMDNMGNVVKVINLKDATNYTLSVAEMTSGVYHLRVKTTDGKVSLLSFVKE